MNLYLLIWGIPITSVILYCNIKIGPAKLQPIPEGYNPSQDEYFRHPITRWMAKNVYPSEQQEYEKNMHYTWEDVSYT